MGFSRGPNAIADSLVLALDGANLKSYPTSGLTWKDLSGNGNNGTLTNGPTFDTANNGSIVFDGTNDYVNVADSSTLDGFSSVTFEAWVNPSNSASYRRIFDKNYNNTYNFSISNDHTFYIYINGSYSISSSTVNLGQWQQLAATYDGTSAAFYINGELDNTNLFNQGTVGTNSDALRIGMNYNSISSQFIGKIALCKIYSRNLSAIEILQNYNATRSRFGL